jgi:hypothetical protein
MIRKAIFFEEAYKQGLLPTITSGYIFSINVPEMEDVSKKLDPFMIKMISYSGLKTIFPFEDGVKFQAQGKSMYCMLETQSYPQKHVEPASRSSNSTAFMPYRFSECEIFFTKDSKFRVLIPTVAHESLDSFTVNFPGKGDICILYYIYDNDLEKVVFPFMEENISYILREDLQIRKTDADNISVKFMSVVKEFHL